MAYIPDTNGWSLGSNNHVGACEGGVWRSVISYNMWLSVNMYNKVSCGAMWTSGGHSSGDRS